MEDDERVCDACRKRIATWHLTDCVEGRMVQRHLCDRCHGEQEGDAGKAQEAFARLIAAVVPEIGEVEVRQCPACGIDYLEFRQTMKLGCPRDYEVFDNGLDKLLERIHGATRHTGKVAPAFGTNAAVRNRQKALRRQQERAIFNEDYELAAQLRDRMKKLEEHGLDATEG